MSITVTNIAADKARQCIGTLMACKLQVKAAYRLRKLRDCLNRELKAYDQSKRAILIEHARCNEQGQAIVIQGPAAAHYDIPREALADLNAKLLPLYAETITTPRIEFPLDIWGSADLPADALDGIGPWLVDEADPITAADPGDPDDIPGRTLES